jgi:hypothetical protein
MRRHFFSMVKQENQSMQAWIASIRHATFELEAANFQIQDIDLLTHPLSFRSVVPPMD